MDLEVSPRIHRQLYGPAFPILSLGQSLQHFLVTWNFVTKKLELCLFTLLHFLQLHLCPGSTSRRTERRQKATGVCPTQMITAPLIREASSPFSAFRIPQVQLSLQTLPLPSWDFSGKSGKSHEKNRTEERELSLTLLSIRRPFPALWAGARGLLLELPLCRCPHSGFVLLIGGKRW